MDQRKSLLQWIVDIGTNSQAANDLVKLIDERSTATNHAAELAAALEVTLGALDLAVSDQDRAYDKGYAALTNYKESLK